MSDTTSDDPRPDGPDQGGAPPPNPGGGPPGPPGGGGIPPALAAIARARMQPRVSQPGMGTQAGAMLQVQQAVALLQQALPALGVGSDQHKAVLKAISDLAKHVGGQDQATAGAQQTQLQDMMRNTMRNAMLQRLMAQRGGGQAGPAPSTPLPGA